MLFWYWIPAVIGGYFGPYVYNFVLGHPAPTEHWRGIFLTMWGATLIYVVQTLGAGIRTAIQFKTLRVYAIWDVVAFVTVLVTVLCGYMIPRDKSPAEGMTWDMSMTLYLRSLYIFMAAYFVCWLLLRWLFRASVLGTTSVTAADS